MRLYGPKSEALTGKWNPPPVVKSQATVGISAQRKFEARRRFGGGGPTTMNHPWVKRSDGYETDSKCLRRISY